MCVCVSVCLCSCLLVSCFVFVREGSLFCVCLVFEGVGGVVWCHIFACLTGWSLVLCLIFFFSFFFFGGGGCWLVGCFFCFSFGEGVCGGRGRGGSLIEPDQNPGTQECEDLCVTSHR